MSLSLTRWNAGLAVLALTLASCSDDGETSKRSASGALDPETLSVDLVLERSASESLRLAEPGGSFAGIAAPEPDGQWLLAGNDVDSENNTTPTVYRSTDGAKWEAGEVEPGEGGHLNIADIAQRGDVAVMVGRNRSGADQRAAAWVSDGGGRFERVDGAAFDTGTTTSASFVTSGPGGFIAVGSSGTGDEADTALWSSPDGHEWTAMDDVGEVIAEAGKPTVAGLAFLGETMVITGSVEQDGDLDAAAWMATPGEPLRRITADAFEGEGMQVIRDLVVVDGALLAAGHVERDGKRHSSVWRSADGRSWELVETHFTVLDRHVNTFGASLTSVRPVGDGLVAIDDGGANDRIMRSDDGVTWTEILLPQNVHESTNYALSEIAAVGDDYVAISTGAAPLLLRAVQQIGFLEMTAIESVFPAPRPSSYIGGITDVGDRLVAWGGRNTNGRRVGEAAADALVWESEDGRDWKRVEDPAPFSTAVMVDVAAFGDGLVAIGKDPYVESVIAERHVQPLFWNAQGEAWTRTAGADAVPVVEDTYSTVSVIETKGGLVATGTAYDGERVRGLVWTSDDGVKWNEVAAEQGLEGVGDQFPQGICSIEDDLVTIGYEQVGSNRSAAAWVSSTNGTSWERSGDLESPDGADDSVWSCVSTAGGVVAIGAHARADGTWESAMWQTTDGRTWTDVTPDSFDGSGKRLSEIATDGDMVVAIGSDDGELSGDPAVWTSADGGITWEQRRLDLPALRGTRSQSFDGVHLADGRVTIVGSIDGEPATWSGELPD